MKIWTLIWRLESKWPFHLLRMTYWLRCHGSQPAMCDGRFGILRQYCHLHRWHRGLCVAPIDVYGHDGWSRFECKKEWVA